MNSISGLDELKGLQKITFINCNLTGIDEIRYLTKLEYIYLNNTTIQDYKAICGVYGLRYFYLNFSGTKNEENSNSEIKRLSDAMKNAEKITDLQYLGIFGDEIIVNVDGKGNVENMVATAEKGTMNNLTDLSSLSSWNKSIKDSLTYAYFNNNKISNVDFFSDYKKLYEVWVFNNSYLQNLDGLKSHTELKYLISQWNYSLANISGLAGCTNLYYIRLQGCSNLESLRGLEASKNLYHLTAFECNLTDITALEQLDKDKKYIGKLFYLNLEKNANLQNVGILANCTSIRELYLDGNRKMLRDEVKSLANIIKLCGSKYRIPEEYSLLFDSGIILKFASKNLTDYSMEISSIKGRTSLEYLRLYDNSRLSFFEACKINKRWMFEHFGLR